MLNGVQKDISDSMRLINHLGSMLKMQNPVAIGEPIRIFGNPKMDMINQISSKRGTSID